MNAYSARSPIHEQDWQQLARDVAYLRSDLEPRARELPNRCAYDRLSEKLHACWHLVFLASVAAHSVVVGWWLYAVACMFSFLWFQWVFWPAEWRRFSPESEQSTAFYPFANESEWLAHAPLLTQERLPPYDAARRCHDDPRSLAEKGIDAFHFIRHSFVQLEKLAIALIVGSLIWPICLVVVAVRKRAQ